MRTLTRIISTASLAGLIAVSSAAAQEQASPLAGERVRVTVMPTAGPPVSEPRRLVTGRVVRLDGDKLVITDASGAPMEIPLVDVARLELRTGVRRNMGKGSLIGAGVGIAVGGVAGAIEGSRCEGEFLCFGAGGGAAMGAMALGGIGSIVGLVIGAMVTTDRWSDVSSDRWSLAVQPAPDGFARGGVEVGFRIGM